MDLTPLIPCSALPSVACASYIATLFLPSRLIIRSTNSLSIKRVINLDPLFAAAVSRLIWTESSCDGHRRLLVSDSVQIRAFDMDDERWDLLVNEGLGGVRHVDWSSDGNHILVWSDFQLKLTVWSLNSGGVIIANPKFANKGFGQRPGGVSQFAMLQRTSQDMVCILDTSQNEWKVNKTFAVDCSDAQGILWSPDGKWLTIWDSFAEHKVLIYTADGRLLRTFRANNLDFGLRLVEWSPDAEYLAIASCDGKVRLLNHATFSPAIELLHPDTIRSENTVVWRQVTNGTCTKYDLANQPLSPFYVKRNQGNMNTKDGIGSLLFSPQGSFIATRSDNMPTTLWIWSLRQMLPIAILVHNCAIKTVQWHPQEEGQIVLTCQSSNATENNAIYLWSIDWAEPRIVGIPRDGFEVKWVHIIPNEHERETGILIGNSELFTVGYPIHSETGEISDISEESQECVDGIGMGNKSHAADTLGTSLIIHDSGTRRFTSPSISVM